VWLVAPLVIYLIKKNRSRYVRYHAAQSLNMVITYLVYFISLTILSVAVNVSGVALLLFLAIFALEITDIVYLIKAAVMANRGELYRVPRWLCFRMIR